MAITERDKDRVGPRRPVAEEVDIAYGHADGAGARREEAMTASFLNFLTGLWLVVAPFVLAYGENDPVWNDVVFGASVAVLAVVRMVAGPRAAFLSAVNLLIGGWLFASAFWLYDSATAAWNDGITGVIIMLLAVASLVAGLERRRMDGREPGPGRRLHATTDEH
ncbi:MAG: SPW repeat protein [Actinomycetota bacterium]|nr:SPW repeat protein [Actinomycetota bacterium]